MVTSRTSTSKKTTTGSETRKPATKKAGTVAAASDKPVAKKTVATKPAVKKTAAKTGVATTPAKKTTVRKTALSPSARGAAKGQVGSKSAQKTRVSPEERYQMIAAAAYWRAERRSFAPGGALDDWIAAETEIDAKLGQ